MSNENIIEFSTGFTDWNFTISFYEIFVIILFSSIIILFIGSIVKNRGKKLFFKDLCILTFIIPFVYNIIYFLFFSFNLLIMVIYFIIMSLGPILCFFKVYAFYNIEIKEDLFLANNNEEEKVKLKIKRIFKASVLLMGSLLEIASIGILIFLYKQDLWEEIDKNIGFQLFFLPFLAHIPSFIIIINFLSGFLVEDSLEISKEDNKNLARFFQIIAIIILVSGITTFSIRFSFLYVGEFYFGILMIFQVLIYVKFFLKRNFSILIKILFTVFILYGFISFYTLPFIEDEQMVLLITFFPLMFILWPIFISMLNDKDSEKKKQLDRKLFLLVIVGNMCIYQAYILNFKLLFPFHPLYSFELYIFFLLGILFNAIFIKRKDQDLRRLLNTS